MELGDMYNDRNPFPGTPTIFSVVQNQVFSGCNLITLLCFKVQQNNRSKRVQTVLPSLKPCQP